MPSPLHHLAHRRSLAGPCRLTSILPEADEPRRGEFGISDRRLNAAMAQIVLDGPRVAGIIGELEAAGVAQHVGMYCPLEAGFDTNAPEHFREAVWCHRAAALGLESISPFRPFAAQPPQFAQLE